MVASKRQVFSINFSVIIALIIFFSLMSAGIVSADINICQADNCQTSPGICNEGYYCFLIESNIPENIKCSSAKVTSHLDKKITENSFEIRADPSHMERYSNSVMKEQLERGCFLNELKPLFIEQDHITLTTEFINYDPSPLDVTIEWFLIPRSTGNEINVTVYCHPQEITIPAKENVKINCVITDPPILFDAAYTYYATGTYNVIDGTETIASKKKPLFHTKSLFDNIALTGKSISNMINRGLSKIAEIMPLQGKTSCDKDPSVCGEDEFCYLTDSSTIEVNTADKMKIHISGASNFDSIDKSRIEPGCLPTSTKELFEILNTKSVSEVSMKISVKAEGKISVKLSNRYLKDGEEIKCESCSLLWGDGKQSNPMPGMTSTSHTYLQGGKEYTAIYECTCGGNTFEQSETFFVPKLEVELNPPETEDYRMRLSVDKDGTVVAALENDYVVSVNPPDTQSCKPCKIKWGDGLIQGMSGAHTASHKYTEKKTYSVIYECECGGRKFSDEDKIDLSVFTANGPNCMGKCIDCEKLENLCLYDSKKAACACRTVKITDAAASNDPKDYLGDVIEKNYPPEDWRHYQPMIDKVNELTKGRTTDYDKAMAIATWVVNSRPYSQGSGADYVIDSFNADKGVCNNAALITPAMLRLAGIPARRITMYTMDHGYTEAYLNNKWIGIDSTFAKDPKNENPFIVQTVSSVGCEATYSRVLSREGFQNSALTYPIDTASYVEYDSINPQQASAQNSKTHDSWHYVKCELYVDGLNCSAYSCFEELEDGIFKSYLEGNCGETGYNKVPVYPATYEVRCSYIDPETKPMAHAVVTVLPGQNVFVTPDMFEEMPGNTGNFNVLMEALREI